MKFRWRIRHKLTAALVLVVGMIGLLSAGSIYGLYSYRRSNRIFNYHHAQLETLGYLHSALSGLNFPSTEAMDPRSDINIAKREKLLTIERVDKMLHTYRESLMTAVESSFSRQSAEKQLTELNELEAQLRKLKTSVTGEESKVVANAPSDPRPFWFPEREREIIERLNNTLTRLRGVISTEINRQVETNWSNYRLSQAIVYSTSLLVLGMIMVLVWLVYRTVFQPIRELHRGVIKLAAGNFDSRVHLDSGDEMQELGEAFNDMTDRLQGIYKDLNRQVEERSRQLIRSERLASVGFLAAGVAHEINNPLASIAFCGEALESRLRNVIEEKTEHSEVVSNYLQMIQQEAFRCKAITEKLLDFSRVGEPARVDTDIVALIRSVMEMVQHLGRVKGKSLLFSPKDAVIARVNPQELKQVLLNLVVNGLESVDEGGAVRLEAVTTSAGVQIAVLDDGCGMSDDTLKNLFEPFFTRNRTGKGTGLGLSISHLIISQHGGSLNAASDGPGKGSRFTIQLPAAMAARAA